MNQSHLLTKRNLFISLLIITSAVLLYSFQSKLEDKVSYLNSEHYEVDHPFPIEATNLLEKKLDDEEIKSRLNKHDIRYALDEVFRSEGFDIEKNTKINVDNINMPVSTYDRTNNIGYVLMDYDLLGAGLLDDKLGKVQTLENGELDFLKFIDQGVELYFEDDEKFLNDLFGNDNALDTESYDDIMRELWKSVQEVIDNDGDRQKAFATYRKESDKYMHLRGERKKSITESWDIYNRKFENAKQIISNFGEEIRAQLKSFSTYDDQREYLELILREFKRKLEIEYLMSKENKSIFDEWKLSAADMIEEPERFFGFAHMVDNIRIYSPTEELSRVLNEHIFEIVVESDRKEWWKRSKAVFELFNANENPGLFSKVSYKVLLADIMSNDKYSKWHKRYHEITSLGDKENISLYELNALNKLAVKNGMYIAPVSILDDRLIYDMEEEKYLDSLAIIRTEINKSKKKEERNELHKKLLEFTAYRASHYNDIRNKAKAKSIAKLQADMCAYIQWARGASEDFVLDKRA